MTSGTSIVHPAESATRRTLLIWFAGIAMGAHAESVDLSAQQLFSLMGGQQHVRATFTERKFIRGLDAPVESSGELSFEAPSRLTRRTLRPREETLLVDGDDATVERGGQRRTVSLQTHPEIAVHVEALRACLAGDLPALQRVYRVQLRGTAARWTLFLEPLNEQAAAQVRRIELTGESSDIRIVRVLLADGDSAETLITRPQVRR